MATVKAKTAASASDAVAEVLASARAATAAKRYSVAERATRGRCSDGTTVALGTLAAGKLAGREEIVHENGTAQSALPYHVILCAIRDGVIPRDVIAALIAE